MVDPSVPQRDLVVFDWNVENGKQWKFLLSTGNSSYSSANPGFKSAYRGIVLLFSRDGWAELHVGGCG